MNVPCFPWSSQQQFLGMLAHASSIRDRCTESLSPFPSPHSVSFTGNSVWGRGRLLEAAHRWEVEFQALGCAATIVLAQLPSPPTPVL